MISSSLSSSSPSDESESSMTSIAFFAEAGLGVAASGAGVVGALTWGAGDEGAKGEAVKLKAEVGTTAAEGGEGGVGRARLASSRRYSCGRKLISDGLDYIKGRNPNGRHRSLQHLEGRDLLRRRHSLGSRDSRSRRLLRCRSSTNGAASRDTSDGVVGAFVGIQNGLTSDLLQRV